MDIIIILIAAALICLIHNAIYRRFWRSGLSLSLRYEDASAFEGDSSALIEIVSNDKALPLPWVVVKFQVSRDLVFPGSGHVQISDNFYRSDLFSIVMRQRITRRLPFTCSKRGYFTIRSADLISGNILGTEKFASREDCGTYLTVYPAFVDTADLELPFRRINGSFVTRRLLNPDPFEFLGVREYIPSDPLRSVNFKASAKTGVLMSNEYGETLSQEVVLILNLEKQREWITDDIYECAIRLAASMAEMALSAGVPLRFASNGRDILTGDEAGCLTGAGESQLYNILESLARIDLSAGMRRRRGVELMEECLAEGGHDQIYVLVSPYNGSDLREAYARRAAESYDAVWILPYYGSEPETDALADNSIFHWEVAE